MFIRSPYNYDRRKASVDSGLECRDGSRTVQSMAEEADINTLVKRFGLTGKMPVGVVAPSYADFDEIFDFQTAMNAVLRADRAFLQLPADVRYRFANDPHRFVEFCSDEKNAAELNKLGLLSSEGAAKFALKPDGSADKGKENV